MGRVAILTATAALFVISPPARAQRDQDRPSDKEAMRIAEENSRAYVDAVNAQDAAKLATFYAPDGERVVIDGIEVVRQLQGPAGVADYYRRLFSENPQLRLKTSVGSAHFVTPDVPTTAGTYVVTGLSGGSAQGRYFGVARK